MSKKRKVLWTNSSPRGGGHASLSSFIDLSHDYAVGTVHIVEEEMSSYVKLVRCRSKSMVILLTHASFFF